MEIKNWRIIIFFLFKVLREHESDVNCIIHLDNDRIPSATKDKTIRIWKIDNVEENVKKILYNGRSFNRLSSWNVLFN